MDRNGIPYWSGDDIDDFSARLLAEHLPGALAGPSPTEVLELALALGRTVGLRLRIDSELGLTDEGEASSRRAISIHP